MHLRSQRGDCVVYSTSHQVLPSMIPRGSNSLLRKRLRAGGGGSPPPWTEQQASVPGNKRDKGSPATRRQSKRSRVEDSFQPSDPMWNRAKASGSSSCVEEELKEESTSSENSEQQCCYPRPKSVDPKQPDQPDHKTQDASDSSTVTEEAIARDEEEWFNLDLLVDCAARELEASGPSRVFVPCLGFTICRTRRPVRRAAPRREFGSLLLRFLEEEPLGIPNHGADGEVRSRSKRKRPVLLPSKLQDSVLLLKNKRNRRK